MIKQYIHTKLLCDISLFMYLWFKSNLDRRTTHPKVLTGIQTYNLWIMNSIFHGPETLN